MRLYDDSAIIISNSNSAIAQMFTQLHRLSVANKLSINSDEKKLGAVPYEKKTVPRNFTCIQTDVMQTTRVKPVQYLGILLDAKLILALPRRSDCVSLVKYFGVFNHIIHFFSLWIWKQLYYAFIDSRIQYDIEGCGSRTK